MAEGAIAKKDITNLVEATQFSSPEEVLDLNAQVVDATKRADEMIEEIDQLGHSLDKFIEKQKLYNGCRRIIRRKLQDAITEM